MAYVNTYSRVGDTAWRIRSISKQYTRVYNSCSCRISANIKDESEKTAYFMGENSYASMTSICQAVKSSGAKGGCIAAADVSSGDEIIATAILYRWLHHATTIAIRGEGYRLPDKRRAGLMPDVNSEEEA